jgi:hypothetical protein
MPTAPKADAARLAADHDLHVPLQWRLQKTLEMSEDNIAPRWNPRIGHPPPSARRRRPGDPNLSTQHGRTLTCRGPEPYRTVGVGNGGGRSVRFLGIPLRQGYIEIAQRDIKAILGTSAPLAQRWSSAKRRQAARRTLRRLMGIYCPDLLDSFDRAVEGRVDWATRHRQDIEHALEHGLQPGTLAGMIRETMRTTTALVSARDDMKRLILERYPIGTAITEEDPACSEKQACS